MRVLGINGAGLESGNEAMCLGRRLPWLQDLAEEDAWGKWRVDYRDLVILDGAGRVIHVYNLTQHDLADSANYAELKRILLAAAQ